MRLLYVSPSVLPSTSANSVHVVHQCEAFARLGASVTLFAKRSIDDPARARDAIRRQYGVELRGVEIASYFSRSARGENLRIALHAVRGARAIAPDIVLCRNLYAAYALAVLRRQPIIYETHQLERGARKLLQRGVVTRAGVLTVVISDELRRLLAEHVGASPARSLVLHDAAADGIEPLPWGAKRAALQELLPDRKFGGWQGVCGYFGSFLPGRGVDLIEEVARQRPSLLFLLFGADRHGDGRAPGRLANVHYPGFVSHPVALQAMKAVDVLLMPYQQQVSIGIAGHDTSRWMSPMKMFEYLASGTPIVASDLKVLREVLIDGRNALLVAPGDVAQWVQAVDRVLGDPGLARSLGREGHASYARGHTWSSRARRILEATR